MTANTKAIDTDRSARQRTRMVQQQIANRGIDDPQVLAAMAAVPRHAFVSAERAGVAYDDCPLPIGAGQTISQPYMVAIMAAALRLTGGERVLEVGAGCGYAAAVLAQIAGQVFAIERIATLADDARRNLAAAGIENVTLRHGDGTRGWPDAAPFDAILVSAGGSEVPEALRDQLKIGGVLVIPLGDDPEHQRLIRITRRGESAFAREDLGGVRFVPLISGVAPSA